MSAVKLWWRSIKPWCDHTWTRAGWPCEGAFTAGGHLCVRDRGHKGRCRCTCGSTSTKAQHDHNADAKK